MRRFIPLVLFVVAITLFLFTNKTVPALKDLSSSFSHAEASVGLAPEPAPDAGFPASASSASGQGQGAPAPDEAPMVSHTYSSPSDQNSARLVEQALKAEQKAYTSQMAAKPRNYTIQEITPQLTPPPEAPVPMAVPLVPPVAQPKVEPKSLAASAAPDELKVTPTPSDQDESRREGIKRFYGSIVVSLVVGFCSIFIILSKKYPDSSNKWAYATIGTILVYWLK